MVVDYYSLSFLLLAAASLVLVLAARGLRRDPALLAIAGLAAGSVVVSQLWRLEVPFEYRRAVYYFGLALVAVIGVASVRLSRSVWWASGYVVVLAYIAHVSVGFRLPERLLTGPHERSAAVPALIAFREQLDSGTLPDTDHVVADRCLHFVVPFLVRRPTLAAFEEWQCRVFQPPRPGEKGGASARGWRPRTSTRRRSRSALCRCRPDLHTGSQSPARGDDDRGER